MEQLARIDDFIPTRPRLLAYAHTPHNARKMLIARARRVIHDSRYVNLRLTWVGEFNTPVENLDHGPRATNLEVLMDQRVPHKLA